MLRRLYPCLAALVLSSSAAAQDLEVYFIDVGQGDSTLIISPTGQTFLFDAGDNGMGWSVVVPQLNSLGITSLDYASPSHYHADHLGGLDEVWDAGIRATVALDRGTNNTPGTQSYSDYASRYSGRRQTVAPGQVVDLGGGCILTCVVVEGDLMGGGSVNISGSSQWENSASIGWHLEYGDFDMFLGGDLTGGGNNTTDVESSVAPLVGNVDVYQANHHSSRTSTNATFVNFLQPDFVVIPCGTSNPFGYPKQEVVDRLNNISRTVPVWCVTDGNGFEGYVDAGGTIHLTSDGNEYTVTALDGTTFTAFVDELAPTSPGSNELVVAEFMRDPSKVSDSEGEWIELAGARTTEPVSLDLVQVTDLAGDSFTLRTSIRLDAGEEILLGIDGLPGRNGGYRPHIVWPIGSSDLINTNDTILLRRSGSDIDRVDYTTAWPGSSGRSAERMDLAAGPVQSNFTDGVSPYGLGDLGTPGEDNDSDITSFNGSWIEVITSPTVGGIVEMDWHFAPGETGALYQGWITLATTPGVTVNGTHIPANIDKGWDLTNALPGWSGFVPASLLTTATAAVPNNGNLAGTTIYGIFVTYKDVIGQGTDVRTIADPVPMVIQ